MSIASRISKLAQLLELEGALRAPDPRLSWYTWPDKKGAMVLALVDFYDAHGPEFAHYGGPAHTPGFSDLPSESQPLLCALYTLYGANWRFADIIDSMVHPRAQYVVPYGMIAQRVERTRMRRRFPGLLRRFAARGSPWQHYDDHGTPSHAPMWPESASWTDAERDYIQQRYFQWYRVVHRHPGCLSGPNRNPFSPPRSW